jgi:LacI family transcriptional regulator
MRKVEACVFSIQVGHVSVRRSDQTSFVHHGAQRFITLSQAKRCACAAIPRSVNLFHQNMEPDYQKKRVTVRDIARRLKVSHATVSRSLRDDRRISEPVRQKVKRLANEMGYRPDPMLSALMHYRRGNTSKPICAAIAWINHWPEPKQLRSFKEFDLYWQGAMEESERCGFRLEEFIINKQLAPSRLEKILLARNIQGIMIPPHGTFAPEWGDFNWDNFCVVRFGHSVQNPRAHIVTSDQLTDGLIAFENMWKQGYRRIGLVSIPRTVTRFGAGYLFSQMRLSPQTRIPPLIFPENHDEKIRCRIVKSWLNKHSPDAILTDVAQMRGTLEKIGYEVPADMGLAAFSVLDGCADAGVYQNSREIGKAAVQMLISLINHNERGVPEVCRELLIEGRWVNGSTLPPKYYQD